MSLFIVTNESAWVYIKIIVPTTFIWTLIVVWIFKLKIPIMSKRAQKEYHKILHMNINMWNKLRILKMSDYRVKKSRSTRKSHFVEDVTICSINDPLPPHHPTTPPLELKVCWIINFTLFVEVSSIAASSISTYDYHF